MSDYDKIRSQDLLRVVGWRGGTMQEARCALLELSVATTDEELQNPKKITLLLDPETAEKVISSIRHSLSILQGAN
jgi:hypothetical protein